MTIDYCDIETLHAYGGFQNPTDEDDALLALLISAASRAIDNYCSRVFGIADGESPVAKTFTHANGHLPYDVGLTLWLEEDLLTPTAILGAVGPFTYIPDAPPYNRIYASSNWTDPSSVTGYWSYSMTPPTPIIVATLRLSKWMYMQKESTDSDRPIIANGIVIMPSRLPKDVEALLEPYRKVRLV